MRMSESGKRMQIARVEAVMALQAMLDRQAMEKGLIPVEQCPHSLDMLHCRPWPPTDWVGQR